MTDDQQQPQAPSSRMATLFDIRLVVGGLLSVYGLILFIKSFFDTDADIAKAAGTHLNLWTGVGMLVVGLAMLAWMRLRPLQPPSQEEIQAAQTEGPQSPRSG